ARRVDRRVDGPEVAALRSRRDGGPPARRCRDASRSLARPRRRARVGPLAGDSPRHGAFALTEQGATKWVDVDTSAISDNVNLIKQLVGPKTAVLAVVKANGYGH